MRVVDINNKEAQELYERRLVLVRPDGQVAWRNDLPPEDPLRLINTIRGALTASRSSVGRASRESQLVER
jgi:hypothetical protein